MAKKGTESNAEYTKWQARIKAAVSFRNKIITDEEFRTYSNYYKGRFNKDKKKVDRVEVNMVFSTTNLMMSALASKDPWVAFKSRKDKWKSSEPICEEATNNTLQDIKFKDTLQLVIRDAQLYGYGVGKSGYMVDADVAEKKEKKSTDEKDTKEKKDNQPDLPQYHIHIKKDSTYFNRIDPKKLLLDPTSSQGIKDAKCVIEVLVQNKEFISKKYGVKLDKIAAGIPAFIKDKFEDLDKESQKVFDMCVFYEIWDIIKEKRKIMIEGYTEEVLEYDWPEELYDEDNNPIYPFDILIFNHAPDEPYGISDVGLYRTQQEELNVVRSVEAEHTKKNNCKWQAESDGVELKEIRKFMANETGTVVGVKKKGAIDVIPTHNMTTDFDRYEARIVNDIRETLGVNAAMSGGGGGKKTATQSYSEDFFAKLRIGQRQNEVDNFVLDVSSKQFGIMQKTYDAERFVEVVGEDGKYIAKAYTKKDLEGEFDKIVQQGTGAQNKAYMSQTVGAGLKLLTGNPLINPKEYTDIIIDVFFDGVDTSKLMIPNAEQIANDPIEREKWRQIMLTIAQGSMLQSATKAIQAQSQGGGQNPGQPQTMPGGSPIPGQPAPLPQAPGGQPPVPGM